MKMRKVLSAVIATAIAASAMMISASAVEWSIAPGEAILGFGDADWKAAGWGKVEASALPLDYFTVAKITGNGTYTVAVDLSAGYTNENFVDEDTGDLINLTTANGIGAMGINLYFDAEDEAYKNLLATVTSIKFDGVETMKSDVVSFTNNEDGIKRTNIMNSWASFDASKEDYVTSDATKASTVLTDFTGEWSKVEVTFTVSGLPEAPAEGGDEKGSAETGVEGIAVVAGLAILATGAIVVSKKRK